MVIITTTIICSVIDTVSAAKGDNNTGDMVEVFRDDFARAGFLDPAKWNAVNHSSMVNEELEYYTPDDVSVQGGSLTVWNCLLFLTCDYSIRDDILY